MAERILDSIVDKVKSLLTEAKAEIFISISRQTSNQPTKFLKSVPVPVT